MYNIVSWRQQFVHGFVLFLKLLLIPLCGYIIYLGYMLWSQDTGNTEVVSYGLEEDIIGDTTPYGSLIFRSVMKTGEEEEFFSIYEYDFATKESKQIMPYGEYYALGNEEYSVALSYLSDTTDPDGVEPIWYKSADDTIGFMDHQNGYNETDLTTHPEKELYAYSYQVTDSDSIDIDTWSIAVYNVATGEWGTLPQAVEPKFSSTGEDVFYMTTDGIYRYNIATQQSYPVTFRYNNFSVLDDFTVSPDDSTLIITSPSLRMISLNQLDESFTAEEFGVIVTPDTRYRHPVISPDNRLYTVMAAKDSNQDGAGSYTTIDAELRALTSSVLLDTVSFTDMYPDTVRPVVWR